MNTVSSASTLLPSASKVSRFMSNAHTASPQPYFARRLNAQELSGYQQTIQDALKVLGKDHVSLIAHGASFPSEPDSDTGFGSPNALFQNGGAKQFIDFLAQTGFNSIQLGPAGKTKRIDASPYVGTTFSDSPMFIDLKPLAYDPAWGGILSAQTFSAIVAGNPNPEQSGQLHLAAYEYAFDKAEVALNEAYQNYVNKAVQLPTLKNEFETFKQTNKNWLASDALYEALSEIHQNDYWPNWPNELDKYLMAPRNAQEASDAKLRVADIQQNYADVIDRYAFIQFIASKQKQEAKAYAQKQGVNLIADRQVGFSDRDRWAYQHLFMEGFSLGAPPDYFSVNGQAWGFPVLDPDKIFNPDGSLGEGGQFLKAIFDKTFAENPGGVRIDHIVGLIDPWVYPSSKKSTQSQYGGTRLYSSPEHPELGKFSRVDAAEVDYQQDAASTERVHTVTPQSLKRYSELIQLIMQSARDQGLDPDEALICEDLGTLTEPVKAVMKDLNLSGIRVTQFVDVNNPTHLYRGKNVASQHWLMVGSHDNQSVLEWVDEKFKRNEAGAHARILAEDLIPDDRAADRAGYEQVLKQDPMALLKAKLAEVFASPAKNVQIFFTDLFGIKATYNTPGTSGQANWALRIPNAFEDVYEQKLKSHEALNLPEVLAMAIESKGNSTIQGHQGLLASLRNFATILQQ